jgi:hypothetical protein
MPNGYLPASRRWFRFGLQSLMALVLVAAVCSTWVGAQLKWIRERHQFGDIGVHWPGSIDDAPWQLRPFGEYGAPRIRLPAGADKNDQAVLSRMRSLFPESVIVLFDGRELMPDGTIHWNPAYGDAPPTMNFTPHRDGADP